MTVLLVDNYDSFTHNLYQALAVLGAEVQVVRNDRITPEEIDRLAPSHVVLSPGPGRPERERDFGVCRRIVQDLRPDRRLLGVCLGHQGIAHFLGGRVVPAPTIMHGKTSPIRHRRASIFRGFEDGFEAMRYHSLTVDRASLPPELEVVAETDDGVIMGLAHRRLPVVGVQFHPESIGTPDGPRLLDAFLRM